MKKHWNSQKLLREYKKTKDSTAQKFLCGEKAEKLNVMANFNLANNSFVFVREGLGIELSFEKIIDVKETTDLTFRPLEPPLYNKMCVIWKKYQMFTPVAEMLLEEIKNVIQ